jgi:hypothetical protein
MKKVITILISCSLALAASVIAQQDEQQQKPKKQKAQAERAQPEKSHPANEARPAPKPQQQSAPRQHAQTKAPSHQEGTQSSESTHKSHMTKAPDKERANANADKEKTEQRDKERNATNESETANKPPGPAPATEREQSGAAGAPQVNNPNAQPNNPNAQLNKPNAQGNKLNAKANKPDPQTIQRIKTQHASFRAQPRPDKVPAATFSQNYRINGAERWQGPQYQVFRSYHPEWHDRNWYHSHFNRVELIGGGYYYWNNGYWFPAWGYDTSAQYYAYDAPIYVGSHAEPPDRVIADVQATLQEMGYYQGEVDGLLGPLTREALTAYQNDHGLYATAVIDEPTLSSLGMS